jgi:transcriptional regulator with XRE-family HTH domain
MTPQETFVTRLRRHRQRNRVSLDEIAAEMHVKREWLEGLENNDLSEWPRGLYARALIRTYASVVGLDPGDTVDEFCRLFPQGDRRANGTIREIAAIVAAPSEYRDEFPHRQDRRGPAAEPPAVPPASWHTPVTQGFRAVWTRVVTAAGPYLRARRAPRTTL